MSLLLFGGGGSRVPLIRPGWLSGRMSFARAQAGGAIATTIGADDATWSEVAADVPRYYGSARRLRVEGQRTNSIRNPRVDGLAAGSPGTLPTNWIWNSLAGITRSVVGTATVAGMQCVDLRFVGTATGNIEIAAEGTGAISGSSGQTWSSSWSWAVVAGSLSNVAFTATRLRELSSAPAELANTLYAGADPGGSLTRQSITRTLTNASTVSIQHIWRVNFSGAVDVTIRIGWPQLELASFASTPILPASGTPAAATRGADLLSAPLARLGIRDSGACTVLMTALATALPASGASNFEFLNIDAGVGTSRYVAFINAGTSAITLGRLTAGAYSGSNFGTVTAGQLFAMGMSVDGTGRAAASFGGATAVAVTGGPTAGLTTLRPGVGPAGLSSMFGEIDRLEYLPFPVSDAQLQALVAAMPTT